MIEESFNPNDKSNVIAVADFEIDNQDTFHLKKLYEMIHEWFMDHDYKSPSKVAVPEHIESLYFQKNMEGGLMEHVIWWRPQKIPDNNPYLKFFFHIDFQTIAMSASKVEFKGHTMKTNKGEVVIRCKSYIILDYKNEWKKSKFLKLFHNRFKNVWYKKTIEFYKNQLFAETYDLQSIIKQYLTLKNPHELQKPFHPEKGL